MNVDYRGGRREILTGLSPEQLAEHARRVSNDPEFERAEIMREKEMAFEMNGETNRHARRKYAAQQRRKHDAKGK